MTRENKLSIVIAFGLLIFVGMLVADHYSNASHRKVADLGSNMPTPPLTNTTILEDGPPAKMHEQKSINRTGDTNHVVKQGETLRSICSTFYGDSGLATAVANWNGLQNPNDIEVNSTIALPKRESLVSMGMTFQEPIDTGVSSPTGNKTMEFETYEVKSGDTLSEIAQKVMGTTKKTQVLIMFNKDVMPNPDRIRPGMILKYPK